MTTYIDPKQHVHDQGGSNERLYWYDKKGRLAIVFNWLGCGKWKVLPDIDQPMRHACRYTKMQYDSFADALRVHEMLCATKGLTQAAA